MNFSLKLSYLSSYCYVLLWDVKRNVLLWNVDHSHEKDRFFIKNQTNRSFLLGKMLNNAIKIKYYLPRSLDPISGFAIVHLNAWATQTKCFGGKELYISSHMELLCHGIDGTVHVFQFCTSHTLTVGLLCSSTHTFYIFKRVRFRGFRHLCLRDWNAGECC